MRLNKEKRVPSLWIPFLKVSVPSAFYWMDSKRYGRYFDQTPLKQEGVVLEESDMKRKTFLQNLYQEEIVENGKIYAAIFMATVADERTKARDYLVWLSCKWQEFHEEVDRDSWTTFLQYLQTNRSIPIQR